MKNEKKVEFSLVSVEKDFKSQLFFQRKIKYFEENPKKIVCIDSLEFHQSNNRVVNFHDVFPSNNRSVFYIKRMILIELLHKGFCRWEYRISQRLFIVFFF